MNLAWKEIKKNKVRFTILGSIVFLVSFLTFIISGLANGLSQDNAALIKNLPEGYFYMEEEADESFNLSLIPATIQESILDEHENAMALSIQMGFLNDSAEKQHSVAFVMSTPTELFVDVAQGEVFLDSSLKDKIKVGDTLSNIQLKGSLTVKGFIEQEKYSHAPVAFINEQDFKEMYRTEEMQLLFLPDKDHAPTIDGLQSFTKEEFLKTIPSYNAEQLSLNMIVWFLLVISGMLFAIFFYMMNVQKIGLYGILKAIGVKTSALFKMMWVQMLIITMTALALSMTFSQLFGLVTPDTMPFNLPLWSTIQLSITFLVIGFIGATLSGLQIKKVQPLQAIQQGEG